MTETQLPIARFLIAGSDAGRTYLLHELRDQFGAEAIDAALPLPGVAIAPDTAVLLSPELLATVDAF